MYDLRANGDAAVAEIAARQHGIVSTAQLRAAGIDKHGTRHRVCVGRLHRAHRGVYAVGHAALSFEGRCMAAVLACGGGPDIQGRSAAGERDPSGWEESFAILDLWGAAISHRSGAELWRLLDRRSGPVDVSIVGDGGRKRRRGIRVHRSATLRPADVTLRNGIPVTKPARTIADLRRTAEARRPGRTDPAARRASPARPPLVTRRELHRAIRQAEVLGLPVAPDPAIGRTRSELEAAFLRLCRRHRLPAPEANVRVGDHLVDFLWPEQGLIVETDGWRYHDGQQAFEDDRTRDLELRRLGYQVIRVTGRQLDTQPGRVVEVLASELAG